LALSAPPSVKYAAASPSPTLKRAAVNSDGSALGSRSRHSTSQREASTLASSSRAEESADRRPATVANVNAGNDTNATMNRIGGVPRPSHSTTELM
jgi:hypothetical protein